MFVSRAAALLWGLLAAQLLITATLSLSGSPDDETIIRPLRLYLDGYQQSDSWRPMQTAEAYLESKHDAPVYDTLISGDRGVKFQYPLSSLLFTRSLDLGALNRLSWWTVVLVFLSTWLISWKASQLTPFAFQWHDVMAALAWVGLTLTFYPIIKGYALGQIQTWINAAAAVALLAFVLERDDVAGLAIGFACLVKPTFLLFGVWGVARRRWRFLGPLLGCVLLGGAAAWVVYGFRDNANYLHALSLVSSRGEVFAPNQSFNGFLNRLLGNGDSLKFDRTGFVPFNPIVYWTTLAAFVGLVGLAVWRPIRAGFAGTALDFGIFTLTMTMTSPIAWDHHYGVVLPVFAATAPVVLTNRPFGRWTGILLAVAYLLIGQALLFTNHFAGTKAGVLQSYQLLGAVLLLVILYTTGAGRHGVLRTASVERAIG